jgi:outer membrane protein assembly factor BamA
MAGIAFQWQNNHLSDIRDGGFLDSANIDGKSGGNILGLGPHFRFDNRDNTLYTTKGYYLETYAIFNPHWSLSDYSYYIYALDFRAFTTVFSKENILALQAYFLSVDGSNIPFYLLPKLGGDQRLRGIEHENRYTDKNAYYFQAEGRRHLFWRIGGVLFAGLGDVNSNMNQFSFKSLKFVYGIGGRFQPLKTESLNIRLDAGKGPGKQYAIYFSLSEAF